MDPEDLRRVLRSNGVDVWTLIETAIAVAARDHGKELRSRRDAIVERLYASPEPADRCRNCEPDRVGGGEPRPVRPRGGGEERGGRGAGAPPADAKRAFPPRSPQSPEPFGGESPHEEEEEEEEERTWADPDQSEDSLVSLLQNLADMDITFKALKETDIGRHVNELRKHPSGEIRRIAKQLVRKWKDLVDEWVKSNSACDSSSPAIITDGDSPLQIPGKNLQQNNNQVPEFAYSPYPHNNGGVSSDTKNGPELLEPKAKALRRGEAPTKPNNHAASSSSATPAKLIKEQKESLLDDPEKLASARRRLQENYQEAQNAKKQRTIQVMDIHEIPKPKNTFVRKSGIQAKHW
uniref:TFIIS N-terminal domain-containing protein n=1 Tax=Ananas comosus var. bracteatus TaxID=296719 RepID=A0A6V7QXU1_ANACO